MEQYFFKYKRYRDGVEIRGVDLDFSGASLAIPKTLPVKNACGETIQAPVLKIGANAFNGRTTLRTIAIPASVTIIGKNAFRFCSLLSKVDLPEELTFIDEGAFAYCESLESIKAPVGLVEIAADAFLGCRSLTTIVLPGTPITLGPGAIPASTAILCENGAEPIIRVSRRFRAPSCCFIATIVLAALFIGFFAYFFVLFLKCPAV